MLSRWTREWQNNEWLEFEVYEILWCEHVPVTEARRTWSDLFLLPVNWTEWTTVLHWLEIKWIGWLLTVALYKLFLCPCSPAYHTHTQHIQIHVRACPPPPPTHTHLHPRACTHILSHTHTHARTHTHTFPPHTHTCAHRHAHIHGHSRTHTNTCNASIRPKTLLRLLLAA